MKRPKLILIMGQPGTGKTTIAYKLADYLGVDHVISTDILKTALKSVYNKDTNPTLFTVTHESWQLYGEKTYENIYKGYFDHCTGLYPYINYMLRKFSEEGLNLIVEGAHILPYNYHELDISNFDICPIYLCVNENEELLHRYDYKNMKRTIPYKKWKENYEIIRYVERCNLSKTIQNRSAVKIIETGSIEETFNECKEVVNEVLFSE